MIYYKGTADKEPVPVKIIQSYRGRLEISRDVTGDPVRGFFVRPSEIIKEDDVGNEKGSLCI